MGEAEWLSESAKILGHVQVREAQADDIPCEQIG